ncbi:MAG: phosphatase PAP2 family protein [Thermoleophilia bacterium]|nr:phosphatase PAP2 family protein [Thermoleophilia bacterium]
MSQRTPEQDARAIYLDQHGGTDLWWQEAAVMRQSVGVVRGVATTALMALAMGTAVIDAAVNKLLTHQRRPFQIDGSIVPLGPIPRDSSFPSGHAAASAAAADVLAHADPEHAARYEHLADEVARARVYSGVHLPSDVAAGRSIGDAAARIFVGDRSDSP